MDAADAAELIAEAGDDESPAEHSATKFRNQAALLIAVLAAVLAICGLGGGNATDDMLFYNIKSSDTWAFYQAKNVRQNLYKVEADALKRDLAESGAASTRHAALEADLEKYGKTIARYESEPDPAAPNDKTAGEGKRELMAKAKSYEAARDLAIQKDGVFDLAEMILQLAIVLGSVSILAMSRPLLYGSAALGVIGAILTANGFLLLFPMPF
ncbi:MAG: DUF4337 domain-containing protein [Caulobacteraceae bacterium]